MNKFILLLISFFFAAGCTALNHQRKGTVTYVNLESGFYGIVDESGNKYLPINLPEAFKKDGLYVTFQAVSARDQMSMHQWGRLVELKRIEQGS